jgi:hypothetical protein
MGCFEPGNKALIFIQCHRISSLSKFLVASEEMMSLSLLRKKRQYQQKTQWVSITNTIRLILFNEAIGVQRENRQK